jgi:hypothetical protein
VKRRASPENQGGTVEGDIAGASVAPVCGLEEPIPDASVAPVCGLEEPIPDASVAPVRVVDTDSPHVAAGAGLREGYRLIVHPGGVKGRRSPPLQVRATRLGLNGRTDG